METLKFGPIEVRPALRQLCVSGVVSPIGARAFDLLLLLVQNSERVVSREEILETVWPGVVVEENNLNVQISTLRRALGSNAIATVTGRGYRFTAAPSVPDLSANRPDVLVKGNLPVREVALFGRNAELSTLVETYADAPCVTICGLAGVGKTALANLAAQRLAATRRYAQGAWRVELADVRDPTMLVQAICEVVGIPLEDTKDPSRDCIAHLQHHELLLVLDNCEHIVDAVAMFVGQLLAKASRVNILATSQEALRVAGECVMRLDPLEVPLAADTQDAGSYGAVSMLRERVRGAMGGHFNQSSQDLIDLIEICRQLDGIPLALEFAATRVPLLGLAGVRSRLHDRLRLLAGGPRTAPSRHRSLQAALEWSHQLLSPRTQQILHRLAIFPSGFSLVGAQLLLDAASEADIIEHLDVLVDRSMVTLKDEQHPRYRMLETTRAFALDCLREESDPVNWEERHALTMAKVCFMATRNRDTVWMWQEMPNARSALAWALTAPDHNETALTIATYTSVVMSTGGTYVEALGNLLRVKPLLTDSCPLPLAARYWHWLGRLGVEGRLPSALCVEALQRADAMFTQLGEHRHRHACQRHLAEAAIRSGHVELAEEYLQAARRLEEENIPPADRVRMLRVEAMLADARGQHGIALRHAQTGLTIAEAHGIDRYRLLLMAEMGWTHLQMGHADAAVTSFQELLLHLDQGIRHSLARARAMAGLTAALVAADRVKEAVRMAARSVKVLQQVTLIRSRCDVFAWVVAAAGDFQTAAQFIGAGDDFEARTETRRDPISHLARKRGFELIESALSDEDRIYWFSQGAAASEAELTLLLECTFTRLQGGVGVG